MKVFSWAVILFALIGVPFLWGYGVVTDTLYQGSFLLRAHINAFLWDISWWSLIFVMSIRPLADIFPKFRTLRKWVRFRKEFGILTASVVVTAFFAKYIQSPHLIANYISLSNWSLPYPLLSRVSEITGFILLITSNTFSQRLLKRWWKRIQRTSYLYLLSGGFVAGQFGDNGIYYSMGAVLILWLVAKIKTKIRKKIA